MAINWSEPPRFPLSAAQIGFFSDRPNSVETKIISMK
jgi:hypothetical protein